MHISEKDQARFWSKVALPNGEGCMLWMASKNRGGYGQLKLSDAWALAHRVSYVIAYGAIPDGLVLDHLCRVRHCMAPLHLEAVDNKTNILRGVSASAINARKTHCVNGHAFDGENTYVAADGQRRCHACRLVWAREYRLRLAQVQ